MRKAIIAAGITISIMLLGACGQTGPLYPPGESEMQQPQAEKPQT